LRLPLPILQRTLYPIVAHTGSPAKVMLTEPERVYEISLEVVVLRHFPPQEPLFP